MKMKKKEVMEHMIEMLDCHAYEFLSNEDVDVRERAAEDFAKVANAYNSLLIKMFKKVIYQTFTTRVEVYIDQRDNVDWK